MLAAIVGDSKKKAAPEARPGGGVRRSRDREFGDSADLSSGVPGSGAQPGPGPGAAARRDAPPRAVPAAAAAVGAGARLAARDGPPAVSRPAARPSAEAASTVGARRWDARSARSEAG